MADLTVPDELAAGFQAIGATYAEARAALVDAQQRAGRADELAGQVDTLTAQVRSLDSRLGAVTAQLNRLTSGVPEVGASVDYGSGRAEANWETLVTALQAPLTWYRWFGNPVPPLANYPTGARLLVSAKPSFPNPTAAELAALQAQAKAALACSGTPRHTVQHEPDNASKKLAPAAYAACYTASRAAVKSVDRCISFGPIIQSWTVCHRDGGDSPWLRALDPDRVDWVGIDVYPEDRESTEKAAAPAIALARKLFGSDIPLVIPEWGYPSTAPNRAQQIADGWAYFTSVGHVEAVLYYHYGRWALSSDDGTLAAYADVARHSVGGSVGNQRPIVLPESPAPVGGAPLRYQTAREERQDEGIALDRPEAMESSGSGDTTVGA